MGTPVWDSFPDTLIRAAPLIPRRVRGRLASRGLTPTRQIMKATDLTAYTPWLPIGPGRERELLATLPASPGVYVIARSSEVGRLRGASDILYIGMTKASGGLRQRIRQYFHPGPTQTTNLRINRLLHESSDLVLGVRSLSPGEASAEEDGLLARFEREHGELPSHNRQQGVRNRPSDLASPVRTSRPNPSKRAGPRSDAPNSETFYRALRDRFTRAEARGERSVAVNAGDLHREVGGYPGPSHRMATCCDVMWSLMDDADTVVAQPPKRRGASLTIRYRLPRQGQPRVI